MSVTFDQYTYLDHEYGMPSDMGRNQTASALKSEAAGDEETDFTLFGDDGFGFDDFLDIINPLQHIPVISSLYRELTGDEINPGSRIIGGGVFGGAIGLATSVVNTAIEAGTGKDAGEHVISFFQDSDVEPDGSAIASAQAKPTAASTDPLATVVPIASALSIEKSSLAPLAVQDATSVAPALKKAGDSPTLHSGLQWKGDAPDIHKNIQNASTPGHSLTEDQLSQIMGSFKLAKPSNRPVAIPQTETMMAPVATQPIQKAAAIYEKQANATEKQERFISESFDYLDRLI